MSSIFGGSKQTSTSTSGNQAYNYIRDTYSPIAGSAMGNLTRIQDLLSGDATGLNRYKQATGFDQLLNMGSRGITGNAAASGLLRSGSTGKALANYGNTMQNQFANSYLQNLSGLAGMGLQAGNLISSAGNTSTSNSSGGSTPGLGGSLGGLASLIAVSDPRLKMDVIKIGDHSSGLGVYEFKYIDGSGPYIGVMADEVEEIMPEALGPVINGFKTVDYAKLNMGV